MAFLEYLYTDHSPIEESDSVGILLVADEYCQQRLVNLCELYITKEVDRSVSKNIEKSEIDVIGLLYTSQVMVFIITLIILLFSSIGVGLKFQYIAATKKKHT